MKKLLLSTVMAAGLLFGVNGPAHAQILVNGGFEADSGTIGTGKIQTGFGDITGWQNIGSAANNSGVQYGTPGVGLNSSQAGDYFAFEDSDDGNGTNGGAFQISNTLLQTGDQITLTWYAANAFGSPTQVVDLLAADSTSSTFSSATVLTPSNSPNLALNTSYTEYTLDYTVPSVDAGKYLGVSFTTAGATNSFAQYDSFVVTDIAAVPEPATYALWLAGFGGLLFAQRTCFCRDGAASSRRQ